MTETNIVRLPKNIIERALHIKCSTTTVELWLVKYCTEDDFKESPVKFTRDCIENERGKYYEYTLFCGKEKLTMTPGNVVDIAEVVVDIYKHNKNDSSLERLFYDVWDLLDPILESWCGCEESP